MARGSNECLCRAAIEKGCDLAAAASAAFAGGCSRSQRRSGWLNYLLGMEPLSLDPAKCAGGSEVSIMAAIYEPLIRLHPETMAPMAGLSTNYKSNVEERATRSICEATSRQRASAFPA